ncbi:hypothetical protein V6N12_002057 [Hibiscus sabdariffa]|uniref:DNA topoisomerase I eukaryotic-type domain-containing protein n=1 Tax=Hibiscus sabdariffa TaxID=183260 RepID=A0ABR2A4J9_9ROSI
MMALIHTSWKDIKHDNTVTWLAFWNDPINPKELKYVFLTASSSLKGQSDKEKYEKARMLKEYIKNISATYTKDFASKDVTKRQIAVTTYLIDKLALRADEKACSKSSLSSSEGIGPARCVTPYHDEKPMVKWPKTFTLEPQGLHMVHISMKLRRWVDIMQCSPTIYVKHKSDHYTGRNGVLKRIPIC